MVDFAVDPRKRTELLRQASKEKWVSATQRYEWLRLARLCHYLRVRQPDAMIGYSIFIYRLNAEEVTAATGGSLREWSAAIERALKSADN